MVNKTIFMTYKKKIPDIVFDRWKKLNPDYNIVFSLDNDCINFLKHKIWFFFWYIIVLILDPKGSSIRTVKKCSTLRIFEF